MSSLLRCSTMAQTQKHLRGTNFLNIFCYMCYKKSISKTIEFNLIFLVNSES